jgi:hypothetical protein
MRTPFQTISLAALLLSLPDGSWAGPADKKSTLQGDAETGRDVFNGKGGLPLLPRRRWVREQAAQSGSGYERYD